MDYVDKVRSEHRFRRKGEFDILPLYILRQSKLGIVPLKYPILENIVLIHDF